MSPAAMLGLLSTLTRSKVGCRLSCVLLSIGSVVNLELPGSEPIGPPRCAPCLSQCRAPPPAVPQPNGPNGAGARGHHRFSSWPGGPPKIKGQRRVALARLSSVGAVLRGASEFLELLARWPPLSRNWDIGGSVLQSAPHAVSAAPIPPARCAVRGATLTLRGPACVYSVRVVAYAY